MDTMQPPSPFREHWLRLAIAAVIGAAVIAGAVVLNNHLNASSRSSGGDQTITYAVWASPANVTYGPAGSQIGDTAGCGLAHRAGSHWRPDPA